MDAQPDSSALESEPKSDVQAPSTETVTFCSEFCESSYDKYLNLRLSYLKKQADAKLELEKSLNKSVETQSSTKMSIRWQSTMPLEVAKVEETQESKEPALFELVKPTVPDRRSCCFCNQIGDLEDNGPGRLLTMDVGKWCHLNCALWSNDVYETMAGAFINVEASYKRSINIECVSCHQRGGSVKCFMQKCNNYYHLACALKEKCALTQDKVNGF